MKYIIGLLFVSALFTLMPGCADNGTDTPNAIIPGDLGRVALSFSSPPPGITKVIARISRPGYETQTMALTISDSTPSASGSFDDVQVGVWHLRVEALDDSSVVRFAGETDVDVPGGQITHVALQLMPTSGGIQIIVTWGNPSPGNGLMAYYPLNGNANDVSGNGNNGVVTGALLTTDRHGHPNSAYWFDGIDDKITIPSSPSLHPVNQLTISFWIWVDSLPEAYVAVLHKGGQIQPGWANREYAIYLKEHIESYYYFLIYSAGNGGGQHEVNSGVYLPHQWLFFTAVYDRQHHVMKSYINGVLNGEVNDSYTSFNMNNDGLTIGNQAETGAPHQSPFLGALDEIRLYNRALTGAEIQALYNSP